ncbi:MAG: hypothetical protein ACYTGQ_17480, partial [Planctomycetota bacterium]
MILSAEWALTRDAIKRTRWLFAGLVCAAAGVFLLFDANLNDPALHANALQMHHILLGLMLIAIYFLATTAVCDGAGNSVRVQPFAYRLPRSTPWIVAWQMLIAMGCAALGHVAIAYLARTLWGFDWPVLTLTAVMATLAACAIAIVLLLENTPIIQLYAHLLAIACLWRWTSGQYVPQGYYKYWTTNPDAHIWLNLSVTDALTLTGVIGLAYAAGVYGATRNRCGEGIDWPTAKRALARTLDRLPWRQKPFPSRVSAQLWYEWRVNGSSAVIAAVIGLLFFNALYLFGAVDADELLIILLNGCLYGPVFCTFLIAIGYTHFDTDLKTQQMSLFRATQPVSDTRMLLDVLAASLACWAGVWVVAAIGFAATCALVAMTGHAQNVAELIGRFWGQLDDVGLMFFFGFYALLIVKAWVGLAFTGTWILWGRPRLLMILGGCAFAVFFATMFSRNQGWLPAPVFDF